MGRRRRRRYAPNHPRLFPDAETTAPLPEEALREAVKGLAVLLLASLGVRVEKGGKDDSQGPA